MIWFENKFLSSGARQKWKLDVNVRVWATLAIALGGCPSVPSSNSFCSPPPHESHKGHGYLGRLSPRVTRNSASWWLLTKRGIERIHLGTGFMGGMGALILERDPFI